MTDPRPRETLGAFALFLLAAVVWAGPAGWSPADTVPDAGDSLHLGYVMAWDAHQIVRRPWALFDSNSFHPYPRSLAFGDHLLPQAVLVAPVQWITGNAVLASNLTLLLALALSATAMFVLVARATRSLPAALVAGAYFGFNSFTRAELARVQVLSLEWWPLALLFLAAFALDGRARDARRSFLFFALQGLSSAYYLVYTAVLTPVWMTAAFLAARRRPGRDDLRAVAGAAALAVVLGLVVLWPYAGHMRTFSFEKPLAQGQDVACHVAHAAGCGDSAYLGLGGLALGVAGLVALRRCEGLARVVGRLAVLTAVLGAAFSWGPRIAVMGRDVAPGPFALLYALLPIARSMDGPDRSVVLAFLGLAILAGLGTAALLAPLDGRRRWAVTAALVLGLPLEHWHRPARGQRVPTGGDVPPVYAFLSEEGRGPLVELPVYRESAKRYWSLYPYFSTYHWRPVPIGRTSFYPPLHDRLVASLREFPDAPSIAVLRQLGVTTVVVHPLAWGAPERTAKLQALDGSPDLELVRAFTNPLDDRFDNLRLGEERVYRVKPALALATPCTPAGEIPRDGWKLRAGNGNDDRPIPAYLARSGQRLDRVRWDAALATDGQRETAFRTLEPQQPGDHLEVVLPQETTVAAIAIDQWYPFDEFPRNLVAVAYDAAGTRTRLARQEGPAETWDGLRDLRDHPRTSRLVLRFPPQAVKRLVLRLGDPGDLAWPAWSVPELRLFASCGDRRD